MTKLKEVYKCEVCGNIVEVVHAAGGTLVCCGQPMKLQEEKQNEEGKTEKHKPVIKGNKVIIGSVEHPMTEEHHIEWIEATDGTEITKVFLKPDHKPEAVFSFEPISARAYCNLHGLWITTDEVE
jgi:superoxide reductase